MNAVRECLFVSRTMAASPAEIFAVLTDPNRHQDTEPGNWVLAAVDTNPITAMGQVFAVNMFLDAAGGHYVMHNLVIAYVQDRTIAWLPGARTDDGPIGYGGWWWRYDLATADEGTTVTLTYDWTDTPEATRAEIGGLPSVPESFLAESLASLESSLRESGAASRA
ncbi:ATPase [Rhodococcus sp. SBT000017]|uniref:ATPase n=1 Tax=Rhodococcus sp. SBT000017 TaxID=1803385 RepID=UPI000EF967AF|nr:ATPase [Rhodococcus sp. SBT000017]RMB77701.1 ATPase [Rhodococcus sp. SBT000017]